MRNALCAVDYISSCILNAIFLNGYIVRKCDLMELSGFSAILLRSLVPFTVFLNIWVRSQSVASTSIITRYLVSSVYFLFFVTNFLYIIPVFTFVSSALTLYNAI